VFDLFQIFDRSSLSLQELLTSVIQILSKFADIGGRAGKLKEMGNSLLGRFGMSIDNFKAVQDPNTGSYSISFQK
jgi:hypothetical protein